jgi:hypothetical protein
MKIITKPAIILLIINLLCIIGLVISVIWSGFAIGHTDFNERFFIVICFQVPCLLFMLSRGWRRK